MPASRFTALPLSLLLAFAPAAAMADTAPVPAATTTTGPDAASRDLPPEVRESIEAAARGLTEVQQHDVELTCGKAVENSRWGIETMLEVGQRNVDSGHMPREEYEAAAPQLRTLLAAVTLADCEAATGAKRAFYACMSGDYNHVMACANQHPF